MRSDWARGLSLSATLFSLLAIEVAFTNCQPQLQRLNAGNTEAASADLASSASAQAENPFANGKVQLNLQASENAHMMQKAANGEPQITSGTSLIAIVSNNCLYEQGGDLSETVYDENQEFENLDRQAYIWKPSQNIKLSELEAAAEADPCLVGLANDAIVHSTGVTNDPYLYSEGHFVSVGGVDTYNFFADPLHGAVKPVVVAVLDSGVSVTHSDLKNMLWNDGSNHNGYNFYGNNYVVNDDFGHGTNVAGLIASQANNGVGTAGVMGHNVQLMIVKIQDSQGNAYISDMVRGLNYAQSSGANVINISMVGYGANAALQSALQAAATANIFIAVAAGNDAVTISTASDATYAVPAIYGSAIAGMMTVGSIDSSTNARSSFSNISPTYVEVAAPGSGSLYFTKMPDTYGTGSGTSYSSPQVAGAAALTISFLKQHGISYTAAGIENILTLAAYRSSLNTSYFNGGRQLDLRGLKEYLSQTYLGPQTGGFSGY